MFPEYRDLISRLKIEDDHFARIFHRHNDLDQQIKNMEAGVVPSHGMQIEQLKKEKLQLKDSLYVILRKAANA
ncbi:MAG TPA: YdcH family protein [Paraburkholderia sp.]|uniref:YdcH family protein n=1 Tax=Paraburkholderia sp. TaxID=1926495 RepID=UPI002B7C8854|nr:YdcH family protein [Paraburkholderia sp.]HTR08754.1 YdcH family protein [Paraburkholderia sp.]